MASGQYRDQALLVKLGKRIKTIREERNWSQEYFAEICDIDTRQLGRIERAETNSTISMLQKIVDKLGMSLSELFEF